MSKRRKHPSASSEVQRLIKQRNSNMRKARAALKAADTQGKMLHALYARSANREMVRYKKAYRR
jgi:molybdopterin-guanine dinucleotide biosynthesis protein A